MLSRNVAVTHLGRGGNREGQLRLAAVVNREPLEEERSEAGAGSAAGGVEDEEALEASAVVSKLADAVEDDVNNLLADGVVTTGIIIGGVLLFVFRTSEMSALDTCKRKICAD